MRLRRGGAHKKVKALNFYFSAEADANHYFSNTFNSLRTILTPF
jgi:hypothetical protein